MQGTVVSPEFYLEYLEPTTSTPLLMFQNEAAVTTNNLGTGHAVLIGTLLGQSATDLLGGMLPLSGGKLQITVPGMDALCALMS